MVRHGGGTSRPRDTLSARALKVHFAGVKALDGVDLTLAQGEIVGLIGPNGSGKTTCLNALTGFAPITAGDVELDGRVVTRWSPERRVRSGIARTFQAVRLFRFMSVAENVQAAALSTGISRRAARRAATEILEAMELGHLGEVEASALPAGDERRVGIARAVATRPRFLLLDEPAAGLNDSESVQLVTVIRALRDRVGCGVLLVEHDMRVVMGCCARLEVLDAGRQIASGPPAEVSADPAVVRAYFGEDAA